MSTSEEKEIVVIEEKTVEKSAAVKLGDLIKSLEVASEHVMESRHPFVVRIDGHGFSKFTRGFQRPMDLRISMAMIHTTQDLVEKYNAVCGFTASDEITLVFPEADPALGQSHIYSGRVQKIASLLASYTSVRFNYYMINDACFDSESEKDQELQDRVFDMTAHFDARVFSTPTREDAMKAVWWRHHFDCYRNAISNLSRVYFTTKQLHRKTTPQQMEMLEQKGVNLSAFPDMMYHGTFVKKEQYYKTSSDGKKGDETERKDGQVIVLRTRTCYQSFMLKGSDAEKTEFIFRKYWRIVPLTATTQKVD